MAMPLKISVRCIPRPPVLLGRSCLVRPSPLFVEQAAVALALARYVALFYNSAGKDNDSINHDEEPATVARCFRMLPLPLPLPARGTPSSPLPSSAGSVEEILARLLLDDAVLQVITLDSKDPLLQLHSGAGAVVHHTCYLHPVAAFSTLLQLLCRVAWDQRPVHDMIHDRKVPSNGQPDGDEDPLAIIFPGAATENLDLLSLPFVRQCLRNCLLDNVPIFLRSCASTTAILHCRVGCFRCRITVTADARDIASSSSSSNVFLITEATDLILEDINSVDVPPDPASSFLRLPQMEGSLARLHALLEMGGVGGVLRSKFILLECSDYSTAEGLLRSACNGHAAAFHLSVLPFSQILMQGETESISFRKLLDRVVRESSPSLAVCPVVCLPALDMWMSRSAADETGSRPGCEEPREQSFVASELARFLELNPRAIVVGTCCCRSLLPNRLLRLVTDEVVAVLSPAERALLSEQPVEIDAEAQSLLVGQDDVLAELAAGLFPPTADPSSLASLISGVLLYGPPGTGKTLLAQVLARSRGFAFLSVSISDVLRGYVGDSERAIRRLFARANEMQPCVVFIDELQALFGRKEASSSSQMLLAQLILELDACWRLRSSWVQKQQQQQQQQQELEATGVNGIVVSGVVVIAATNRPDLLDRSLLRPGRLERQIHIRMPSLAARRRLLEMNKTLQTLGAPASMLDEIAIATDGCSGADLVALGNTIGLQHIAKQQQQQALDPVIVAAVLRQFRPSVSAETLAFLSRWQTESSPGL